MDLGARGMTDVLKLSVVLATFQRAETLRDTLRHLADQSLDPALYEVIVIDDGSQDHTSSVVEEARAKVPFALSYLHHSNHGPGYTQNRGIEVARAPVILLMADDIFMSRDTLKAHLSMHEKNPEPEVAVLGRVIQPPRPGDSVFMRTWNPFRYSDFDGMTEMPYFRFWACNISAKRDFVMRFGPFREHRGRAGPAAHEDPELGYRLKKKGGLRILYCPEALGLHNHVVTLKQACARAHHQGLNFGEFNAYVPEPEITVVYHVFNWTTLGDHLRCWFGPHRKYLAPGDRNPLSLLARYALRDLVFNGLTVPLFWERLAERAERSPGIARLMRASFYRGIIAHHFFQGVQQGNRRFGVPSRAPGRPSPV
jgi:glycosyltransferase involved in cell wall biosynthesis